MAVTHPTPVRNAIANLVVDLLDAGLGPGVLEFQTAGGAEVATLTFSDPAFGDAANGIATANTITQDSDATGGIMAKFAAKDSASNIAFQGSVSTSGADINMNGVDVDPGDIVQVSSLTYESCP